MKKAGKGDNVKVHYKGSFDDGSVFDSSLDCGPLEFKIGGEQVIPGFEDAVIGMQVGETKTSRITNDKAYGPHLEEMVVVPDLSECGRRRRNSEADESFRLQGGLCRIGIGLREYAERTEQGGSEPRGSIRTIFESPVETRD